MANNPTPSSLINAKIYNDGNELLGAGDVEFPDFEYMTESVGGLGFGGEADIPIIGHFKSLTMKIKWNTVCKQALELMAPKAHQLAIYGSIQDWDTKDGTFAPKGVRIATKATPKSTGVGKFEVAKKMEPGSEYELTYIKMSIDGKELLELDKINLICRVDGTDYLSGVRSQLGM